MKHDKTILAICMVVCALAWYGWHSGSLFFDYDYLRYRFCTALNLYKPDRVPLLEFGTNNAFVVSHVKTPKNFAPPYFINSEGKWVASGDVHAAILKVPDTVTTSGFVDVCWKAVEEPVVSNNETNYVSEMGVDIGNGVWLYPTDSYFENHHNIMCFDTLLTSEKELEEFGIVAVAYAYGGNSNNVVSLRVHDVRDRAITNVFAFLKTRGLTGKPVEFVASPFYMGELEPVFFDYYRTHYGEDAFVAATNRNVFWK